MSEKTAKKFLHLNYNLDTSSQPSERYSERFINFIKMILRNKNEEVIN